MKSDLPVMEEARDDDWVAECGVCDGNFALRADDSEDNPAPHGSFCPDCRALGLIAPGVLHWKLRKEG